MSELKKDEVFTLTCYCDICRRKLVESMKADIFKTPDYNSLPRAIVNVKKGSRVNTPMGLGKIWKVEKNTICVELNNEPGELIYEFERHEISVIKSKRAQKIKKDEKFCKWSVCNCDACNMFYKVLTPATCNEKDDAALLICPNNHKDGYYTMMLKNKKLIDTLPQGKRIDGTGKA